MPRTRPTDPAPEADLARGVALHRAGQLAAAEAAYRDVLSRAPDHPYALNYLGTLLAGAGRHDEGIELLRRSVKRAANVPELQLNLGDALAAAGRLEAAESALKKALQLRRDGNALAKLGVVLLRQGKVRPAAHQLELALGLAPDHVDARCALALARTQADRPEDAHRLLAGALAVAPAHLDGMNAIAAVDQRQGRLASSVAWLRRTLAFAPRFGPAHANLGMVLELLGDRVEAARHDRIAVALSPGDPRAWGNFGNLAVAGGLPLAAEAPLRRSAALSPEDPGAWSNLGRSLAAQGRFAEARAAYRRGLDRAPGHAPLRSNLLYLSQLDPSWSREEILAEHVAFGRIQESAGRSERRPHANPRVPDRRLRIGYVSADLARHPVGFFLGRVVPHHDPAAVEVAYYSDRVVEDEMTVRFQRSADLFRRTAGLSDQALAELVRSDRMDVLIDLSGHTAGNRLPVFARKPAPVQVSWLGYYDTTGLTTIDAVLADPWEVEPGDERWYVEKVLRLPCGRLCYGPPADAPEVSAPPMTANGRLSFGCFNRPAKITDDVLAAWTQILEAIAGARLVLRSETYADPAFRSEFARRCRRIGLDADRLDMGATGATGSLAAYAVVDLALDPFPFTGGLTTCEALWMGVPVVTLKGDRPVSRQAVSFLSRVGLSDLVADSVDAYVAKAVALAGDPARLAVIRAALRPRMAASSLTDGRAAARAVEAAVRQLWVSWCAGHG